MARAVLPLNSSRLWLWNQNPVIPLASAGPALILMVERAILKQQLTGTGWQEPIEAADTLLALPHGILAAFVLGAALGPFRVIQARLADLPAPWEHLDVR